MSGRAVRALNRGSVSFAQAEDIESIFEGKLAGAKGLIREGLDFLERLKANEKRETTASEGGLGCAVVCCVRSYGDGAFIGRCGESAGGIAGWQSEADGTGPH